MVERRRFNNFWTFDTSYSLPREFKNAERFFFVTVLRSFKIG